MGKYGKDYYGILNIDKEASNDIIKRAYRKMAIRYHPDHNPNNKDAEDSFKEIVEAYEVLGNKERKQFYDKYSFDGFKYTNPNEYNHKYISGNDIIICANFAKAITNKKISDYMFSNTVGVRIECNKDNLALRKLSKMICYFAEIGRQSYDEDINKFNDCDIDLLKELGYQVTFKNEVIYISW